MDVKIKRLLGYSPLLKLYYCLFEDTYGNMDFGFAVDEVMQGRIVTCPDEEWNPPEVIAKLKCDGCEEVYEVQTLFGRTVTCPKCGKEEKIILEEVKR